VVFNLREESRFDVLGSSPIEEQDSLWVIVIRWHPEFRAGVGKIDPNGRFLRRRKAKRPEPARRVCTPTARVYDKVSGTGLRFAVTSIADALDPLMVIQQFLYEALTDKAYRGEGLGTPPHVVFEEPTTLVVAVKTEIPWFAHCPGDGVGFAIGKNEGNVSPRSIPYRTELVQSISEAWI